MKTNATNDEAQVVEDELRERRRLDALDVHREIARDDDDDPFGWQYDCARRVAQGNLEDGKRTI